MNKWLKSALDGWGYLPWNTNEGETCEKVMDGGSAFVFCEEKITKIHLLRIYFSLEIFCECILGVSKLLRQPQTKPKE